MSGINATDLVILVLCSLPAWLFAGGGSRWLIPYLIAAWAFGPEVRRISDYMSGVYHSVTLLSLIPQAATFALLIPLSRSGVKLPARVRVALGLIGLALCYGTALGVVMNGLGAVYEGTGLLLPLLFVPYAATRPYDQAERDLWLKSLSTVAALVAGYGWYQFLEAPPWDMFWMMESGMYMSQGDPLPLSFRVFSTVNSCGPLGLFLAAALAISLCSRRWRGPFGLAGAGLVGTCMMITQVRLGWVMFVIAITFYILLAKKTNRWAALATAIVVPGATLVLIPMLPGGDIISYRMQTFNNLDTDGSVQGRIEMSVGSLGYILSSPAGAGFGATGVGGKVTSSEGGNGGADNGYLDLCLTLGTVMAGVLLSGIILLAREVMRGRAKHNLAIAQNSSLGLAMFVSFAAGLLLYNILGGVCGTLLWLAVSTAFYSKANAMAVASATQKPPTAPSLPAFIPDRALVARPRTLPNAKPIF